MTPGGDSRAAASNDSFMNSRMGAIGVDSGVPLSATTVSPDSLVETVSPPSHRVISARDSAPAPAEKKDMIAALWARMMGNAPPCLAPTCSGVSGVPSY